MGRGQGGESSSRGGETSAGREIIFGFNPNILNAMYLSQ